MNRGLRRTLRRMLGLAVVATMLLVACGGNGDDTGGEEGPVTLTVGVIPIADVAPLYLGMEEGFFEAEELTIEPQLAEGGAAIIPAVVSGDYQIGFSNTTSLIIGASENVPVQIISQGVVGAASTDDAWDAVLASGDSDIHTPQDLEGKSIAVNTLQNIGPLTINTVMQKEGADFSSVKYVEVPFPDMNAALSEGEVDAVFVVEPFVSQGLGEGAHAVLYPYEQTAPELTVATYFSSTGYIEENPDVVDRFVRAMNRSLEFAQENPDRVREVVLTYTEIPEAAAEGMTLPQWTTDLNQSTIEETAQLAEEYGFVDEQPDINELIREEGE